MGARSSPPSKSGRRAALPAAIVVAGALIGIGLAIGLRGSRPPTSGTRVEWAAPPEASSPAAATTPSSAAPSSRPGPDEHTRERVRELVAAELAAREDELRRTCWAPSAARVAEPESTTFRLRVAFDPAGRQVAFGVADPDDPARRDVAACLREAMPALSVPAPGVRVPVEVVLVLP